MVLTLIGVLIMMVSCLFRAVLQMGYVFVSMVAIATHELTAHVLWVDRYGHDLVCDNPNLMVIVRITIIIISISISIIIIIIQMPYIPL